MSSLGQWLASQGFDVNDDDVPLGRTSTWDRPRAVLLHHTAGSCSRSAEANEARFIRTGGEAPPLAQIMLGQSGRVWMCCRQREGQAEPGRASHAGKGGPWHGIPRDRGNEVMVGIEVQCDGSHPIKEAHPEQYLTMCRLTAALLQRYGLTVDDICLHRTWDETRKIDIRDDLDTVRRDVAACQTGTTTTTSEGDETLMMIQEKGTKGVLLVTPMGLVPVSSPEDRDAFAPRAGEVAVISAAQMAHFKQADARLGGQRSFGPTGTGNG